MSQPTHTPALTEKEIKALVAIAKEADGGHKCAQDLKDDNCSWFDRQTIMGAGFSSEAAKGLMSSLETKGMIFNYEPSSHCGWILTDLGIDTAYEQINKVRG